MLKISIDNDAYTELTETQQSLYNGDESTGYELQDDYKTDNNELANAYTRVKEEKNANKDSLHELQEKYEEMEMKLAKRNGDKSKIDQLNQEKLDNQKSVHEKQLSDANQLIHDLTIGSVRDSIAQEVFITPTAYKISDMESRIKMDETGKTFLTNDIGETIDREKFIADLRADPNLAFAVKGIAGNGTANLDTSTTETAAAVNKGYSDMSSAEQEAYLLAKHPSLKS